MLELGLIEVILGNNIWFKYC